jgi:hypothetical protein
LSALPDSLNLLIDAASGTALFAPLRASARSGPVGSVVRAYTTVGRLSGPIDSACVASLASLSPDVDFDRWTYPDFLRLQLLLDRPDASVACYDAADAAEQQSWLRGAPLLPNPAQYLPQVIDACRTNVLPVFTAVASGNPYPSRYFPERNFNQLVLKSLFNGVPLASIVGFERRRNHELARMAGDYAAERRAAGRTVPDDIGLAL